TAKGWQLDRPLSRVERSIVRCDNIISDLLDYARARTPELRPVDLNLWLGEVLDDQKLPDGITLERCFGASRAIVALDSERFRRVIINLIENAVQAMAGGNGTPSERRIEVATLASDRVQLRIEDTGPGIAPEILPNIFEPLFSTKSFGTGLGLPTVK